MSIPKQTSPVDNYTVSGTDYYTTVQSLYKGESVMIQGHYTDGAGTVVIQYSATNNESHFQDITDTSQVVSGTGKFLFDIVQSSTAFFRLHFNGAADTVVEMYTVKI